MLKRCFAIVAFLWLLSCLASGQVLQIQELPSQGAILGQEYVLPLAAIGGAQPYTWKVVSGDLPPGLKLQQHLGRIVGTPSAAGTYQFTVAVTDSSVPQMQITRVVSIHVIEGLTVDWKEVPQVHGRKISGSAEIANATGNDFDVTVIVVAVNEIGRATTLGYQHLKLAGSATQVIPFGSAPGLGTYYVRVDAAAHRPGKKHIFRASKQTSDPMKIHEL